MEGNQENVLCDITNAGKSKSRKRLKDGSFKVYGSARKSRKVMDFTFENDAKKMMFDAKFEEFKQKMNVKTNTECLTKLMESYESKGQSSSNDSKHEDRDGDNIDDELFMCTKSQLLQLIGIMNEFGPMDLISYSRCGHVAQTALQGKFKSNVIMWNSSQRINNDFLVNYKAIHSYLCSGMLPCQYQKYSTFLNIGLPKKKDFKMVL